MDVGFFKKREGFIVSKLKIEISFELREIVFRIVILCCNDLL